MASTKYTRRFGTPETLEDLDSGNHRIISYSGQTAQLLPAIKLARNSGPRGPCRAACRRSDANSVVAIKYAIRAGIGVGMIPDYMIEDDTDLIQVLNKSGVELPSLPVLFVYPEELKSSKKVQVLRDFLVSKGRQWRD